MSIQLPAIENFKPNGEPTSVAQRWERWLKSFEYFVIASGVTSENRKKALLLHLAGRETQDIYETLTPAGNSYQNTLDALNGHFQVKKNVTFERSKFLSAKMNSSESTEQFITRLRKLSINCEYTDLEDQIRDRVVVACHSNKLRKRLLSDQNLTLNKCIEKPEHLRVQLSNQKKSKQPQISNHPVNSPTRYTRDELHATTTIDQKIRTATITNIDPNQTDNPNHVHAVEHLVTKGQNVDDQKEKFVADVAKKDIFSLFVEQKSPQTNRVSLQGTMVKIDTTMLDTKGRTKAVPTTRTNLTEEHHIAQTRSLLKKHQRETLSNHTHTKHFIRPRANLILTYISFVSIKINYL